MIKFRCHNCNQKIALEKPCTAKKIRCPRCKAIIILPTQANANSPEDSHNGEFDTRLFDIAQETKTPNPAPIQPPPLTALGTFEPQPQHIPTRKLPWLIDIFLYPISAPGLTALAIIILIPAFIAIAAKAAGPFGFFIAIPGFVINILIGLYAFWYLCQCIRESALGGIRAPDMLENAPGLGEMGNQFVNLAACWVCFIAPALIYHVYAKDTGPVFWMLVVYAVIFFPMGLLAVLMFDSFTGLNPLVLIPSIFSTLFQYMGLLVFAGALIAAFVVLVRLATGNAILEFITVVAAIYLLMIIAHLLGRFFWKYQDKLNWEV